ncbi:sensor domain-containing diguanylate cyclase [Methylobacterium sp. BTF04]|nr:sensor domain-containing diguanylate cyclase [Methylobacterium sp. BTF04]NEU12324.1 sensor domain-containing diguanylate cyclase [Methylobacterium sp. BTF04]
MALDIRDREAAATIARLEARLAEQAMALAHSAKIFERASALARIGVWECSLPDETLTWTGGVYDLFDIPRGTPIDRAQTLKSYSEESRLILDALRSQAIAERSGFQFDAEIITATGRRRWMRLTATVECEGDVPVRIFGMKQDITDEKILGDRMRYLAEFDVMTGLPNRSVFQTRLAAFDAGGGGTLLLVDLDGFKQINDTFGHALGDDCLKDASARLRTVCAEADLVARIGGDEFAVVLSASVDARACETLAETIVAALKWPVERGGRRLVLGASVGIARADACSASELFTRADTALYAAKAAGRNTFRTFVAPAQPAASGGSWQSDRDGLRRGTGPQTFHRIEPAPRLGSE